MRAYHFWWRWQEQSNFVEDYKDYCYTVTLVAPDLVAAKELFYKTMNNEQSYVSFGGSLTWHSIELDQPVVLSKEVERE